jgi:hypothetical protein
MIAGNSEHLKLGARRLGRVLPLPKVIELSFKEFLFLFLSLPANLSGYLVSDDLCSLGFQSTVFKHEIVDFLEQLSHHIRLVGARCAGAGVIRL